MNSKKEKANISDKEKQALKLLSKELFGYSEHKLHLLLKAKELIEVLIND